MEAGRGCFGLHMMKQEKTSCMKGAFDSSEKEGNICCADMDLMYHMYSFFRDLL